MEWKTSLRNSLVMIVLAVMGLCSACNGIHLPRPTVQQGNVLKPAIAAKLHVGMTKEEVAQIVGTPILLDIFHQNEWQYAYSYQQNGHPLETRYMTLYFDNERVTKIHKSS